MVIILLVLALSSAVAGFAQTSGSYTTRPIIGSGSKGDGGAATSALLDGPYGLAKDSQGNIYVSESNSGTIRKITAAGIIQRFAGSGTILDGAAGQPALQTDLISPESLLVDADGGLIFFDSGACRIRKVLTSGSIQNLVGTGRCAGSSGGFGGGSTAGTAPPLQTNLGPVGGIIEDSSARLIFSDATNNVVWRLDSDGMVRSIAGTGSAGFGGDTYAATSGYLNGPRGIAYDGNGNLFIADSSNCRLRRVDTSGIITTVAGNSTCAGTSTGWNGVSLGLMNGLAYNSGSNSILISCPGLARVLQYNTDGKTLGGFMGNGKIGVASSALPLQYLLNDPGDILVSGSTVLVADNTAYRVLQVQSNSVSAFAGIWPQLATYSSASSAPLLRPAGTCSRPDGSLLAIDTGTGRILKFTNPNQLAVFAGAQYPAGYTTGDGGAAILATLSQPRRLACAADGNVYVTDGNRIRSISPQGTIQTLLTGAVVTVNSVSSVQGLSQPTGIAFDQYGRLVFADTGLSLVIRYDFNAKTTTVIAGTGGSAGFGGDGGAATSANLNGPVDIAYDSSGKLYIADSGNGRIRQVDNGAIIHTFAGAYYGFSYSDISGSSALSVSFGDMQGLAIDSNNQVYVAETSRVSVIKADGNIYVVSGYLSQSNAGVVSYANGPLYGCNGLSIDSSNRVYVAVDQISQVMMILPPGDKGPLPGINSAVSASAFGAFASVAPGSWIEIYGGNLASDTRSWATADFSGSQAPTSLDGASVAIAGQPAFISYISPTQVNVQVPSTVSSGSQSLTVTTAAGTSSSYAINVNATQPGLFAPSVFSIGGVQYAGALFPDNTYVLPTSAIAGLASRPAKAGDTITFYGIGFGAVTPAINAGTIVQQANTLSAPVQVLFNKVAGTVTFQGLVQQEVGLYQFNVVVPTGLPTGTVPVTFTLGGVAGTQVLYTAISN